MDHFERFNYNKKKLETSQRDKPHNRAAKIQERFYEPWEIGVGSSEKYRSNWERIFGAKPGNDIPEPLGENTEGHGCVRNKDTTSEPEG